MFFLVLAAEATLFLCSSGARARSYTCAELLDHIRQVKSGKVAKCYSLLVEMLPIYSPPTPHCSKGGVGVGGGLGGVDACGSRRLRPFVNSTRRGGQKKPHPFDVKMCTSSICKVFFALFPPWPRSRTYE